MVKITKMPLHIINRRRWSVDSDAYPYTNYKGINVILRVFHIFNFFNLKDKNINFIPAFFFSV